MMAEGKIIDVAVKKTSHSIHLPKQSHQTKSQEIPEHFHSFTDIIFQYNYTSCKFPVFSLVKERVPI
jgi:hypothetical protein